MCTSVCCIDLIGRPPESCCWQRQARRPVDCQTSFDRGPSPKSTGPLWKDALGVEEGDWVDWLDKDSRTNRTGLIAEESGSGKEARVKFRVLGRWARLSKLELRPSTGRSHQLRVQLAAPRFAHPRRRKVRSDESGDRSGWSPQIALPCTGVDLQPPDSSGSDLVERRCRQTGPSLRQNRGNDGAAPIRQRQAQARNDHRGERPPCERITGARWVG